MYKKVNGFEKYTIYDDGRIMGVSGKFLRPWITSGYLMVQLYGVGKQLKKHIHRLLAIAFIPNPENKKEVNHKDGNKLNNCLSNLEWVSSAENHVHAAKTGLTEVGDKRYNHKLTNDEVRTIKIILPVRTVKSLAKEYGVSLSTIDAIKRRRNWKYINNDYQEVANV